MLLVSQMIIKVSTMWYLRLYLTLKSVKAFARLWLVVVILTNEVEDVFVFRLLQMSIFLERRLVLLLEVQRNEGGLAQS